MIRQHIPEFPDPYRDLDPERDLSHLTSAVSYEDKRLIKRVCPVSGLFQQMVQAFFHSVAEDIRAKGIDNWTPESTQTTLTIIRERTEQKS